MVRGVAAEDWNCTECKFSNFARRNQCLECNTPRGGEEEEFDKADREYSNK